MKSYRYKDSAANEFAPPTRALQLDQIQAEIIEWQTRNFGEGPAVHPLMGMAEETGELAGALSNESHQALAYFLGQLFHSVLKDEQNIRGSHDEHMAKAKDALGDWAVYAMAYCAKRGWKFSDIVEETWLHVQKRDWKTDPQKGVVG
jgi:NTP pyrophosphatase (non-canonical NTP hydrolase)